MNKIIRTDDHTRFHLCSEPDAVRVDMLVVELDGEQMSIYADTDNRIDDSIARAVWALKLMQLQWIKRKYPRPQLSVTPLDPPPFGTITIVDTAARAERQRVTDELWRVVNPAQPWEGCNEGEAMRRMEALCKLADIHFPEQAQQTTTDGALH